MGEVTKEYAILQVRSIGEEIELSLAEVHKQEASSEEPLPPVPQIEEPMPIAIGGPAPKTDEERVIFNLIQNLRKYMPEMFESYRRREWLERKIQDLERRVTQLRLETAFRLYLTQEEYEKLGKPTVNDIIKLNLKVLKTSEE